MMTRSRIHSLACAWGPLSPHPGSSWFPLFTSVEPSVPVWLVFSLLQSWLVPPSKPPALPYSKPSLLLPLSEPSFFELSCHQRAADGTNMHRNLPSPNSHPPGTEYRSLTLRLNTSWVLYQEAFILWQVWLAILIFSKMTNVPH